MDGPRSLKPDGRRDPPRRTWGRTFEVHVDAKTGYYVLKSSFSEEFVERLKTGIPPEARAWNENERRWYVRADYGTYLLQMARYFTRATLIEGAAMTDLHTGQRREQLDLFRGDA
jgi:hypothetical protein